MLRSFQFDIPRELQHLVSGLWVSENGTVQVQFAKRQLREVLPNISRGQIVKPGTEAHNLLGRSYTTDGFIIKPVG